MAYPGGKDGAGVFQRLVKGLGRVWCLAVATVVGFPPATEGQADRVVSSEQVIRRVPRVAGCGQGRSVWQMLPVVVWTAAGEVVAVWVKDHQLHGQRGNRGFGTA